jgi:hypothetical protein
MENKIIAMIMVNSMKLAKIVIVRVVLNSKTVLPTDNQTIKRTWISNLKFTKNLMI